MKTCTTCLKQKELTEFRFRSDRQTYWSKCKECFKIIKSEQNKKYKTTHREKLLPKMREYSKEYRKNEWYKESNKTHQQKYLKKTDVNFLSRCQKRLTAARKHFWPDNIINKKNITRSLFRELLEKQNHKCAISWKSLVNEEWILTYDIDHIVPFCKWWEHCKDNIRLLLPDVHAKLLY